MILEKLLEKKDLVAYIAHRIKHLEKQKSKVQNDVLPKKRGLVIERFHGRIFELKYLKKHIDHLKDQSKRFWQDTNWSELRHEDD